MKDVLELALKAFNAPSSYIEEIRKELWLLGVEVEEYGPIQLHTGVYILGKGQNSLVLRGKLLGDITCACKILRPDASRQDLLHEAHALLVANSVGVGPRLYTYTRHVLVLEFIDGKPLEKWIQEERTRDEVLKVVKEVLLQAHRLDKVGLLHQELSRPREHIYITPDLRVYIIDFETSSLRSTSGKKNLTQLLNAFFLSGSETACKIRSILNIDNEKMRKIAEIAREYKHNVSEETVYKIIELIEKSWSPC